MDSYFKELVHTKMKVLSLIILMSFQTRKTFVYLQNSNEGFIFLTKSDACPSIDSYTTTTMALQKVHKEIVNLIHMNEVV